MTAEEKEKSPPVALGVAGSLPERWRRLHHSVRQHARSIGHGCLFPLFSRRMTGKRFLSAEERAKREWLANHMAEQLGDPHSLGFYRKVASTVPQQRLFEALSVVRTCAREKRIRMTRGALFVQVIKGDTAMMDVQFEHVPASAQ